MDKISKVFLDETELKQANKYKDEIGSNPIVCRMLVVLNELVGGYNEIMKDYKEIMEWISSHLDLHEKYK